jgi:hypothetical protein
MCTWLTYYRSRATCNTVPLSEKDVLHEPTTGTKPPPGLSVDPGAQPSIEGAPNAGTYSSKHRKKTVHSVQLATYLSSPSSHGPYTGVVEPKGVDVARQDQKDMEKYLEGWEKDWQEMSASNK